MSTCGEPLSPDQFWTDLGLDLIIVGRYADARRYLGRALAQKDNPVLMTLMGEAYHKDSRLDEAEQCWQKAIEWEPKTARAWLDLGRLALNRGRLPEAIGFLERAARLAPEAYEPVYSLSLAYGRLGRNAEAERYRRQSELNRGHSPPPAGGMGRPPSPPS